MKIVFVILHYCLPDVTRNCINSILNLYGDKEIVVVDNASPDNSGDILKNHYNGVNNVHIITNKINGGFAQGNNIGYNYACENYAPDYIIVINNDTLIKDSEFVTKLAEYKRGESYHIIAPDILTFRGKHQNPYRKNGLTKKDVIKDLWKTRFSLVFHSVPLLYKIRRNKLAEINNTSFSVSLENITPHGAAVIYTKNWISKEKFAFYPGTFLYGEEDLLYLYARKKGYRIIYEPMFQITHLEDMSTSVSQNSLRKKKLFQDKTKIKSIKLTLELFNNNKI